MKFGLIAGLRWSDDPASHSAFEGELGLLVAADAQGWDCAWLADDAAPAYDLSSSVPLAAADLATRTQRIRIGTVTTLRAFFHPLLAAEEGAMLDLVSGGRLDWCAAPADPADDRAFREQLRIIERAWSGEPFEHDGEFFSFPTLECVPRPEQRPRPPMYVLARPAHAASWVGEAGLGLVAGLESSLVEASQAGAQTAEAGGTTPGFALVRGVHCARTRAEAEAVGMEAVRRHQAARGAEPLPEDAWIVGDPAHCRDRIEALRDRLGLDTLLCWQTFGGLSSEEIRDSQRRFIEEVAPAF